MGCISHEVTLRRDESVDPGHHLVELERERTDLRRPLGHGGACGEIPGTRAGGGLLDALERPADPAREAEADQRCHGEYDGGDAREHEPVVADTPVELGGRVAEPYRPVDRSPGGDRYRHVEQVVAERARVASPGRNVTPQSGVELGPRREAAPAGRGRAVSTTAVPALSVITTRAPVSDA